MITPMQNMIAYMDGLLKIEDNLMVEFKDAPPNQIQGIKDNWQQLNMIKEIAIKLLEQERTVIIEAYNQGYRDGESTGELSNKNELDISKFDDANNYFITTFTNQ